MEGGLNRKERNSEDFTHYTREHGGLSHNSVSALTSDADNHLWIGTWGGGLNLLDLKAPRQIQEVISSQTSGGFPINFIGVLNYDPINKGIWIGANQGLYFYDPIKKEITAPLPDKIAENIHGCIGSIIDKEGKLWVGCLEGVYIIDLHSRSSKGEFQYRHLNYKLDDPSSRLIEKITCFYEGKDVLYGWAVTDMAFINEKSMLKEKNSLSLIAQRKDYRTTVFGEYWKITTVTYGSAPIMDSPVIIRQRIASLTIPYRMV